MTETCTCWVCALAPLYGRHCHGDFSLLKILRLQITYLMRGSLESRRISASSPASTPCRGSWVMSIAVTPPYLFGLWSDGLAGGEVSPIVPAFDLSRPGAIASIWLRNLRRLSAVRKLMAGLAFFLLRTIRLGSGRSRSLMVIFFQDGAWTPFRLFKTGVDALFLLRRAWTPFRCFCQDGRGRPFVVGATLCPRRRRCSVRPFLHLAEHAPAGEAEEERQGEAAQAEGRRQSAEQRAERGGLGRFGQQRRGHCAKQADRGLLAVEQIADRLPQRAVDLAERLHLAGRAGGQDRLKQVERLAEPIGRRQTGRWVHHRPHALQLLDQHHQPLQQRHEVGWAGRDRTRDRRAQLALDRRDRRRIGDAGRRQAVLLLELRHRRHRQPSVHAVLGQTRVGAERIERALQPRHIGYRRDGIAHRRAVRDDDAAGHEALHLLEHVVGLLPKLGLAPVDGSPVRAQVAQPDGRGLHRETGAVLAQLLESQAGAGSAIVEVATVRRDTIAEDLAIAA